MDPEAMAAEYLSRNGTTDIGNDVSRAIDLVKEHPGPLIGGFVLTCLVSFGLGLVPLLGWFISWLIGGPIAGGLYYVFLRRIRGEEVAAGDVFAGFSLALVNLVLVAIVSNLLTAVGFFLCVVPGVYLAVGYVFAVPLVIDKKLEFWPAMEVSRRVVQRHWWTMFGLMIVAFLISIAGVLACGVGIFLTVPVAVAALMYAYEDLFRPGAEPPAVV